MADKGDISLIVGADITSLEKALEQATKVVNTQMSAMADGVTSRLKGIAESFAAAFAVKELYDFVNGVAEARARLAEFAERTGTSVENLSKIQGIAKITGASMDDVSAALVKLTKGLATGDGETGKAENALDALGIKARALDGSLRDSGDLYLEVAKKLAEYQDGAGKTAIALDLFGKAGAQQLPLLKAMAENGDLVAKTTAEQAEEARAYEQDLNRLSIQLSANKKIIAGEMIPVADDFVRALMEMLAGANGLTKGLKDLAADGSLREFGETAAIVAASVIDLFTKVIQVFKVTGMSIGAIAASTVAGLSGNWSEARTILDEASNDIEKTITGSETLEARLRAAFAGREALRNSGIDFGNGDDFQEKLKYTGTGKTKKGPKEEDDSKALLAVQRAQFEAEANLAKEYAREQEETNDELYKHNLISIEDYFTQKTALLQQSIASDIAAKEQEIAAAEAGQRTAATERERLTIKATQIKLEGELAVLNAKYTDVSITNTRAMMEAERQRADGLKNLAIASQVNVGNAGVAQDKAALDLRKAMHQESDADAIQEEIGFENRLNDIQRNAIAQRIEMERAGTNDPVKIATLNNELEQLELTHQQKLTQLANDGVLERNKYALAASDAIKDNFTTFFEDLTDRSKKLSDTFKNLFKSIQKSINDQLSKKLTDQLLGSGTSGGGMLDSFLKQILPGIAPTKTPATSPATTSGNDPAGFAALDSAAMSASTSLTGLQDTGIAGMLKGAKDWIAEQLLGKTATVAQSTSTSTATTALAAFVAAIEDATEALLEMAESGQGSGAANDIDFGNDDGGMWGALADSVGSFAIGTDFVPQDMLAMIHKGERIVPAKYNNGSQGGNVTIHQNNNFAAETSRASAPQTAAMVANRTAAAARRNA